MTSPSSGSNSRGFLRDNSLTITFLCLFLLALTFQALSGQAAYNNTLLAEHLEPISFGEYVTSNNFAVDVAENWQSEYLQFLLFILATVYLIQRGSPESKEAGEEGKESDEEQRTGPHTDPESPAWAQAGGWRSAIYSRSLGIVMGVLFLLSWSAQAVTGSAAFNAERLRNLEQPISVPRYVMNADFWNRTLENWQSEFLAVASMVAFSIYLRQRGSSQSKPVGTPHEESGG